MTPTTPTTTTKPSPMICGISTKAGRALAAKLAPHLASYVAIELDILCSRIAHHAAKLQRLAVADCNRPLTDAEREDIATAEGRIEALVKLLGRDLGNNKIVARLGGDPRGHVVKIHVPREAPHGGDTWGRDGDFGVDFGPDTDINV